jgi:hypothetical protein
MMMMLDRVCNTHEKVGNVYERFGNLKGKDIGMYGKIILK